MTYLGDPNVFINRLIPGNVTIYRDGPPSTAMPLYGNMLTVPGSLTYEHISPGLTYGDGTQPWHTDLNQLKTLAALALDPEPPIQAAPELPRRRAMVLDGDIPVGA